MISRVLIALAVLAASAGAVAAADKPQSCQRKGDVEDTRDIQVSGTLRVENYFGPPGYGSHPKTDRKDKIAILKMDYPMKVAYPYTEFHENGSIIVPELQVVPATPASFDAAALAGKHVVVKGKVFEPDGTDHVRTILIFASGARPGGRIGCDGAEQPAGK